MDMYTQGEGKKTNNGVKRNENEQWQIYANQMKRAKKPTVRNEQKINAQKCNNAKMTSQRNTLCKNTLPTQK